MTTRNEKGKLYINTLDLSILFDGLFEIAENRAEVEFIFNNIVQQSMFSAQDKLKELGDEDPDDIEFTF